MVDHGIRLIQAARGLGILDGFRFLTQSEQCLFWDLSGAIHWRVPSLWRLQHRKSILREISEVEKQLADLAGY